MMFWNIRLTPWNNSSFQFLLKQIDSLHHLSANLLKIESEYQIVIVLFDLSKINFNLLLLHQHFSHIGIDKFKVYCFFVGGESYILFLVLCKCLTLGQSVEYVVHRCQLFVPFWTRNKLQMHVAILCEILQVSLLAWKITEVFIIRTDL